MKRFNLTPTKPYVIGKGGIIKPEVKATVSTSTSTGSPSLSYQWISQNGIEWIIDNPTDSLIYAVIVRNGYVFGDAFTEVYIRNGVANIWESKTDTTPESNPYRIALLYDGQNLVFGFVFAVPPHTVLKVPEYGFSQQNPPSDYSLVTVSPSNTVTVLVAYDPMLPVAYTFQSDELVLSMPSPYPLTVLMFNSPVTLPNVFIRFFYSYGFLPQLLLPVME
ncbi:hypothetical protein SBFV3_gp40 [Sulfolobales Beppu filamentous virus 3]|uniref:Uncharacterized protein n=1 Tax=Sulfolobales Beppu filamentous virus 3 TaxID=2493124 RepID=A0A3Q8Q3W8_9VIRU|nr:hypothetical protein HOU83_gp40 [Sulfolobales Beppu filamentous virus 3]AZI75875.1 hypothetical protein SBFV3_gp40 [Sulfolobales Beppu filamentous virus 3]